MGINRPTRSGTISWPRKKLLLFKFSLLIIELSRSPWIWAPFPLFKNNRFPYKQIPYLKKGVYSIKRPYSIS